MNSTDNDLKIWINGVATRLDLVEFEYRIEFRWMPFDNDKWDIVQKPNVGYPTVKRQLPRWIQPIAATNG